MILHAQAVDGDDRSAAFFEAASTLSGEFRHNALLNAHIAAGDEAAARNELDELVERYPRSHEAILSARLNFDVEAAFSEYQNATTTAPSMLVTVMALIESDLELYKDPRLQTFRAHYNLTPAWAAELCRRVHGLGPEIGITPVCEP